jgi:hypothetical protein
LLRIAAPATDGLRRSFSMTFLTTTNWISSEGYSVTRNAHQTVLWTNLGPLRTVWTAPTTCSNVRLGDFTAIVNTSTRSIGFFESAVVPTQNTYYSCDLFLEKYITSGCIPYAFAANRLSVPDGDSFGSTVVASFNSPGIHCPSGWQTVGKYTLRQNVTSASDYSGKPGQPTWARHLILTGGTHIICCPR